LAKTQLIPVVHTIAPFLVERSLEQLKIDFGYQQLGGNFVSVGASYDYASLGCTHHCPGDVAVLQTIPGMEIVVPGTAAEFNTLFTQSYANGNPTYFRLSERENANSQNVTFGKAEVIQHGTQATVIAVGPTLQHVALAAAGLDVAVLYYTTLAPFDAQTLRENFAASGLVLLVEPFYSGTLTQHVCSSVVPKPVSVSTVGVPHAFLTKYGSASEHDQALGLTPENIRSQIQALLHV
jgi:transketolase